MKKHPQKPFHLTSHCDYWYWWYPLTMSWMCFSCICVLVYIFKVGFTVSSVLEPLWPFHPYFARCCNEDVACCRQLSAPWFHGSSFLGFAHLARAMDSKWDFKSSHLFTASSQLDCLHEICGWETGLPVQIFMVTGRSCYSADRSVTKRLLGADTDTCALHWIYDLAGRKTRPWSENVLFILASIYLHNRKVRSTKGKGNISKTYMQVKSQRSWTAQSQTD